MRKLGVGDEIIIYLRELDWADFKAERRYKEHRANFPDYELLPYIELEEPELDNIQRLLDAIEDEKLLWMSRLQGA